MSCPGDKRSPRHSRGSAGRKLEQSALLHTHTRLETLHCEKLKKNKTENEKVINLNGDDLKEETGNINEYIIIEMLSGSQHM